jgi:predicted nuclease of predicted toxin-antitoxin system
MKVLIDECVPADLKRHIGALGHACQTVREAGLASKKNGELLQLAEGRWDVLLTTDRQIKSQQDLSARKISILILRSKSNRLKDLLPLIPSCAEALLAIQAGQIIEVGV